MFKFANLKRMERLQPMAQDLDWLRERFRNPVVDEPSDGDNIVSFRRALPATDHSATALELVDQAAEVFSGIEDHARQIEARAQNLVKSALEKLQLSEGRVETANQALKLAESRLGNGRSAAIQRRTACGKASIQALLSIKAVTHVPARSGERRRQKAGARA
jgi:hypothetical protein